MDPQRHRHRQRGRGVLVSVNLSGSAFYCRHAFVTPAPWAGVSHERGRLFRIGKYQSSSDLRNWSTGNVTLSALENNLLSAAIGMGSPDHFMRLVVSR